MSQLVNTKQPSDLPLSYAFCSLTPPPPLCQVLTLPSLQRQVTITYHKPNVYR